MSYEDLKKHLNTAALQKFKESALDFNSLTFTKPCKCLVIGSTGTFHEFLQPLVLAMKSSQKVRIFSYLRVITNYQIFVVSNGRRISSIASYVAKRDPIYQRLIFIPGTSLPIYPTTTDLAQSEYQNRMKRKMDVFGNYFSSDPKRILPFEVLEANIHTYLTEASHFMKLYVYEIEARLGDQPPSVIYFHDLVEFGIKLEKEMISNTSSKLTSVDAFFTVNLSIQLMDNKETKLDASSFDLKDLNIHELTVCSLSTKADWLGPVPNPQAKYLDIRIIDSDNYQIIKQKSDLFKNGVSVPFQALHRYHRVHSLALSIENKKQSAHLKIDDNLYGPFTSFKIKPLEIITIKGFEKHAYIPIMTFCNPVDLGG